MGRKIAMNETTKPKFVYDPYSLEVTKNPLPYYKELRDNHPVYYLEKYDTFFFSRFDDIMELLSVGDNALVGTEFTVPRPEMISHVNQGAPEYASSNPMAPGVTLPSPYYEEMRRAHIKPLQPKGIAAIEGFVRDQARGKLRELLPQKTFDITAKYAGYVCAAATTLFFGMPLSDAEEVQEVVHAYALKSADQQTSAVDIPGYFKQLRKFIIPAIERRRAAGATGEVSLIDGLINYRTKEDNRALSDDEICNQLVCVFVGITETPPKPVGIGFYNLWKNPDQLAEIRTDLTKNVPVAVEEIIRTGSTGQWAVRTCHKPITVAGQAIKPGQRVMFAMASAGRDERVFESPEKFIWNRPNQRSLVFGYGSHHCLGSHLTRMVTKVLVHEFLAHVKDYEFDMGRAEHSTNYFHWGWIVLPVVIKDYAI
jgi:cytochrome P450